MAIEPIGSMTAMQVQSTVKVTPAQNTGSSSNNTAKPEVVAEASATPKLDDNTATVAKASESNTNQDSKKEEQQSKSDSEALKKAVEDMNKKMHNAEAVYGIHEGTNRVTIKIVDKKTKEIIKELPPEKTLDMITKVWEMAGMLVDEKR